MTKNFLSLFFSAILLILLPTGNVFSKNDPPTPLPLPQKIGKWARQGDPVKYRGEDLFLYINGGADIYHEYGFIEVTSIEYTIKGAGRISVEQYQMSDPASAFGIFTFKTGGKWNRTSRGNLFNSDGYYLNLLKGSFLITITSIDINEDTGRGIHRIREYMEEKVSSPAVVPDIVKKIDPKAYPLRIFFEGDLGLMNSYNLFSASPGILRGAVGSGKGGQVIILEFPSLKDLRAKIATLTKVLKTEGRYSDFGSVKQGIHFSDKKQKRLLLTEAGGLIVVFIEADLEKCLDSAENLRKAIALTARKPPGKN